MIEILLIILSIYLILGFLTWAIISTLGGFKTPDGKPAPFWHCMAMTILMWPAALKAMEIL